MSPYQISPPNPPRVLTVDSIIDYIGGARKRSKLYEDIKAGRLKTFKMGVRRVALIENVDAYVLQFSGSSELDI